MNATTVDISPGLAAARALLGAETAARPAVALFFEVRETARVTHYSCDCHLQLLVCYHIIV